MSSFTCLSPLLRFLWEHGLHSLLILTWGNDVKERPVVGRVSPGDVFSRLPAFFASWVTGGGLVFSAGLLVEKVCLALSVCFLCRINVLVVYHGSVSISLPVTHGMCVSYRRGTTRSADIFSLLKQLAVLSKLTLCWMRTHTFWTRNTW